MTKLTDCEKYYAITQKSTAFAGGHAIHTPRALVDEILGKLPLSGEILVLFNVEFVISLVYTYGIDRSMITLYSDHANKTAMVRRMGVNKIIDTLDTDMKFDVVIGNPPYQDENEGSKNTIYPLFYKKATELLTEGGFVAMITPTAIIKGLAGSKVDKMHMPAMLNPQLINITDIKRNHFKMVGSSFCYFVVQKAPYAGATTIETDWGAAPVVFDGRVPNSNDIALATQIMAKCYSGGNVFGVTTSDASKHSVVTATGDTTVVRTINADMSLDTYTVQLHNQHHPLRQQPKVMMTILGRKAIVDYSHDYIPSAQHLLASVPTQSNLESESFISILNSKIEKFHEKILDQKDNCWYYNFSRALSPVPLNKVWTDAELYAHFNLTQEEIDLIEATVK